ncbi:MAG: sulfotransferase family protein [Devosia sp.]
MSSPNASMVPDFLIIGAMKAGTTTLFRDLVHHPQLYMPAEKEPETLTKFAGDADAIAQDYRSLFGRTAPGQIKGEASTAYAKRPDHEGVAIQALDTCGPKLKLIYLTRDPIRRIVSQYRHEYGLGEVDEDIDTAVLKHHRYVAYSRYDWQIEPWRVAFGDSNLLVLSFEDYIANRQKIGRRVCSFLGVDPDRLPPVETDRAFNANEGKLVPQGIWKEVVASLWYQRLAKPLLPRAIRDGLANRVLSPARASQDQLSPQTEAMLKTRLEAGPSSDSAFAQEAV